MRPTRKELEAAIDKLLPDVMAPGLQVVFCGINPGLYSTAVGHHFARPGNRFWPALHRAGWTDRQLAPQEDRSLLDFGCGLTNVVPRTTARADELSRDEILAGGVRLRRLLRRHRPRCIAFLGLGAYRTAFEAPNAIVGPQQAIEGVEAWALPNPSGLNAHYQLPDFARMFGELRAACEA